jgi:hypothetical protein
MKILAKNIKTSATAHNRTVYASPPVGGLASIRLGQSLRSFPRLIAAQFVGPGLCYAKPLFGPPNRRKQPERYVQCALRLIEKIK